MQLVKRFAFFAAAAMLILSAIGCGDGGSDTTGAAGTSPNAGKGGNVTGKEASQTPSGEAPPPAPMAGG